MNDSKGVTTERRRHARIAPKGAVILLDVTSGDAQHGRIANLSEGGMFVLTHVTSERWLGRNIEVEIRLDGGHAEWLRTVGQVTRSAANGVAIAFLAPLTTPLHRMLDELTTASRASDRVMSVVLIDADTQRRSAMAAGFRATGCSVVEASTPLEAIVRLGEASFEPDVIAVADSGPSSAAAEMRVFVERDHPHAKLVTIGDDVFEPDGIAHWLSSANPNVDLARRVRDVLVRPDPKPAR